MVALSTFAARGLEGPEPSVAAGGAAVLGAAWVLPGLWAQGIGPIPPPCLFHTITGLPCPFCGGTRSFAAMAHGNVAAAAHVYPIGPLLFAALVLAVVYSGWAVVTRRRLRLEMDLRTRRVVTATLLLVLAANWASKLFILGY